jgi:hypothetical protein
LKQSGSFNFYVKSGKSGVIMAVKAIQTKVEAVMERGRSLTAKQIQKMGLANPHDAIYKMRQWGYNVVSTPKTVKGVTTVVYSLG